MKEIDLTSRISANIFQARKNLGMTQKQVSDALGISEGQFSHYEKGRAKPDINVIFNMCLLFNASFDEWLGLTNVINPLANVPLKSSNNGLTLGQRIVSYRAKKHMLQRELAEKIGITPVTLDSYEKDRREPNASVICELAYTLDITGDELLGIDSCTACVNRVGISSNYKNQLLLNYEMINDDGQAKVNDYLDDLVQSGKYMVKTKQVRLLKEQTDDDTIILPVAARSGERLNIVTTQAKWEADIASLVPSDEDDL